MIQETFSLKLSNSIKVLRKVSVTYKSKLITLVLKSLIFPKKLEKLSYIWKKWQKIDIILFTIDTISNFF